MANQRRILIARQDRIGDAIVSTAIPRAIKQHWPDSYVAILVSSYTKDIYINNPYVDKLIFYEDIDWKGFHDIFRKSRIIREHKFTHALMLLPSKKINYLLFYSGIRNRIGVGKKFYQFITFVKEVNRYKYIPLRHEADYCMDLARKIGINTDNLTPEIYLNDSEKKKVNDIKMKLKADGKIIAGFNSTSGNSAPNISEESYFKLIKELQKTNRFKIVVTDNRVPESLQNLNGVEYPNIGSELRASILNFASLDFLVSASTGPMHIAAALGIPTISMFCPLTACSPKLWGPLGNENKIILLKKIIAVNAVPVILRHAG